jgi:hypothetical protein
LLAFGSANPETEKIDKLSLRLQNKLSDMEFAMSEKLAIS